MRLHAVFVAMGVDSDDQFVGLGFLTARIDFLHHLSEPVLNGFRSVPSLAVVPLVVLWFSIDEPFRRAGGRIRRDLSKPDAHRKGQVE